MPGTADGTVREMTVAVATAICSGVTRALEGCCRPGWGKEGLMRDPVRLVNKL